MARSLTGVEKVAVPHPQRTSSRQPHVVKLPVGGAHLQTYSLQSQRLLWTNRLEMEKRARPQTCTRDLVCVCVESLISNYKNHLQTSSPVVHPHVRPFQFF